MNKYKFLWQVFNYAHKSYNIEKIIEYYWDWDTPNYLSEVYILRSFMRYIIDCFNKIIKCFEIVCVIFDLCT